MAVLPALQRTGIGSSLVRRGLADARDLGHGVVIVVGHPGYYARFGFVPAEQPRMLRQVVQSTPSTSTGCPLWHARVAAMAMRITAIPSSIVIDGGRPVRTASAKSWSWAV